MYLEKMHAIATPPVFNLAAAMENPAVRSALRIMAQAGIEKPTGRIALADLDRKLAASSLSPRERLQVKISLERAGILVG